MKKADMIKTIYELKAWYSTEMIKAKQNNDVILFEEMKHKYNALLELTCSLEIF